MSINAKPRGFLFDEVQFSTPDKSAFDLSHRKASTYQFDYLYPILNHSCLPGETYELDVNAFFRTSPLVAPIMQDVDVKFYWFWCPYRIIFPQWRRFISNGDGTIDNSALSAGKDVVKLPFITSSDLVQRGNVSTTSYYRPFADKANCTYKYEGFNSIQPNGAIEERAPYVGGFRSGSLADHLGIPFDGYGLEVDSSLFKNGGQGITAIQSWNEIRNDPDKYLRTYSSLPFRCYNKIWYDWFRDENVFANPNDVPFMWQYSGNTEDHMELFIDNTRTIQLWRDSFDSVNPYYNDSSITYGAWDNLLNVGLLRKCWTKDYLTSALTNPQRGADVMLPLGDTAPIKFDASKSFDGTVIHGANVAGGDAIGELRISNGQVILRDSAAWSAGHVGIDISKQNYVDLSAATSATLNSLRVANAFQKFLEKMARCGTRYVEQMMSMFDVQVPDNASDRVTLISTSRIPLQIQTNSSQEASNLGNGTIIPQGTQVANASGSGSTGFRFTTDEHGILMGLMCIEPRAYYGSSISRDWLRRSYLDFAWPQFGNLGEQEVYTCELMPFMGYDDERDPDLTDYDETLTREDVRNMSVFGYQSRYCEYKYKQDEVHGRFKYDMNYYTLCRFPNFYSEKGLTINRSFLLCNVEDYQNIFTEVVDQYGNTADHFYFDFYFNFKGIRPLPLYGTPTL